MQRLTQAVLRDRLLDALNEFWFLRSVEEIERTEITFLFRLQTFRAGLFVQVFWGTRSRTLSLALIESERRIFGIDFQRDQWHLHPFGNAESHTPLLSEMGDNPIHSFLTQVEDILVANDLL